MLMSVMPRRLCGTDPDNLCKTFEKYDVALI